MTPCYFVSDGGVHLSDGFGHFTGGKTTGDVVQVSLGKALCRPQDNAVGNLFDNEFGAGRPGMGVAQGFRQDDLPLGRKAGSLHGKIPVRLSHDSPRDRQIDIILAEWHHSITMRTTLNVDDDILEVAKSIADLHRISIGQALSDLARKGLKTPTAMRRDPVSGFWVFDVPDDAPVVTMETIQRATDQEDFDEYKKYFPPS
jgi:hypothetical protein